MASDLTAGEPGGPIVPPSRTRRLVVGGVALLVVASLLLVRALPSGPGTDRPTPRPRSADSATILAGEPASIDPAHHGDAGSAVIVAQVFETLTTFDDSLTLQPALAESWAVEDGGRRVVFTLRPDLRFSDGSPLVADDVVRSWRRLLDPERHSPLASLLADVRGVGPILAGAAADASAIGVRTDGDRTVIVDLERPAADFPAITSSPPLAIVPRSVERRVPMSTEGFVGSGGYVLDEVKPDRLVFRANERYWAGTPALGTVTVLTDIGGRSPVEAFEDGEVDVAPVGDADARWIGYDHGLGPSLRSVPSLTLEYLGFDTREPPFDDVRVRRAFAMAVDWRRLGQLIDSAGSIAATGMVPIGLPGRPDGDFRPAFDPAGAKRLLAEAGIDPATMPPVEFVTAGGSQDEAIAAELREHLGVRIDYATMDFADYIERLEEDAPAMWALSWVADYPSSNDFLGVLLGTGSTANSGGWSSPRFDAAVSAAVVTSDRDAAAAAYASALAVVRDEAPAVPLSYSTGYELTRPGLLGASRNGMGILRFAGLQWGEGR